MKRILIFLLLSVMACFAASTNRFDIIRMNAAAFQDGTFRTNWPAAGGDFMRDGTVSMTGNINCGGNGIANATSIQCVTLIATTINSQLLSTTNAVLYGAMNANGNNITNILSGTNPGDAVNYSKLTNAIAGINLTPYALTSTVNTQVWSLAQLANVPSTSLAGVAFTATQNVFSVKQTFKGGTNLFGDTNAASYNKHYVTYSGATDFADVWCWQNPYANQVIGSIGGSGGAFTLFGGDGSTTPAALPLISLGSAQVLISAKAGGNVRTTGSAPSTLSVENADGCTITAGLRVGGVQTNYGPVVATNTFNFTGPIQISGTVALSIGVIGGAGGTNFFVTNGLIMSHSP